MANTAGIREVTLAQISDKTHQINLASAFGTPPLDGTGNNPDIKQTRSWSYEPLVVRVTDHVADGGGTGNDTESMALFMSIRHGEPWVMVGHQTQKITHPLPGATIAPIATGTDYSVIYVDFDYNTFV